MFCLRDFWNTITKSFLFTTRVAQNDLVTFFSFSSTIEGLTPLFLELSVRLANVSSPSFFQTHQRGFSRESSLLGLVSNFISGNAPPKVEREDRAPDRHSPFHRMCKSFSGHLRRSFFFSPGTHFFFFLTINPKVKLSVPSLPTSLLGAHIILRFFIVPFSPSFLFSFTLRGRRSSFALPTSPDGHPPSVTLSSSVPSSHHRPEGEHPLDSPFSSRFFCFERSLRSLPFGSAPSLAGRSHAQIFPFSPPVIFFALLSSCTRPPPPLSFPLPPG